MVPFRKRLRELSPTVYYRPSGLALNTQMIKIDSLAEAMASMLLSHAAHGLATGSLGGTGEITLRDGLVVAAAAEGARERQAWLITREIVPPSWKDAPVDVVLYRVGNQSTPHLLGGVELKWWRKTDAANAANRRRDLLRDLVRAASLYSMVEAFAFVALLSTSVSWNATANTTGKDRSAMALLSAAGSQRWSLRALSASRGLATAIRSLRGSVPIPSTFYTELLCTRTLSDGTTPLAFCKVWSVRKPQKSVFLSDAVLDRLFPEASRARLKDGVA